MKRSISKLSEEIIINILLVHFNFFLGGGGAGRRVGTYSREVGGLLTFPTYRVGAYLRWALI